MCSTLSKAAPHIFNLGHGITPDATPENVAELVRLVKGARVSAIPLEDRTPFAEPDRGAWHLRIMTSRRVAIILFNLGGPDRQEAVRPFLFNLFNDKAIIGAPQPFRFLHRAIHFALAGEIRAKANYALMGGGSPILAGNRETSGRA